MDNPIELRAVLADHIDWTDEDYAAVDAPLLAALNAQRGVQQAHH